MLGIESHVALSGDAVDYRNSTVALAPYEPFGWVISPETFPLCRERGVRFVRVPGRFRMWHHVHAALASLTMPHLRRPNRACDVLLPRAPADVLTELLAAWPARQLAAAHFMTIDEGIGSYMYRVVERRGWFAERPHLTDVKRRFLHVLWHIGQRWVESRPMVLRYAFDLDPDSRQLQLAPVIGETYRDLIKVHEVHLPRDRGTARAARAVVLSEPNAAYDWYPEAVAARNFLAVIRDLLDRGYRIYVKPHPSEQPSMLRQYLRELPDAKDVTILDPLVMAEAVAAGLCDQDVIVGFTSTALISTRVMFGRRTFSASRRLLEDPGVPADSPFRKHAGDFPLLAVPAGVRDIDEVPFASS